MKINLKKSLVLVGLLSFLSYADSSLLAYRDGGFEREGGYDRGRGYYDNNWRNGEGVYNDPGLIMQNEAEDYARPTQTFQYDPYNAPNNQYEPSAQTDPYYQWDDADEQE